MVSFQIHLMGYNSHLYRNYSDAVDQSHGVVGIAILVQIQVKSDRRLVDQITALSVNIVV